MYRIGAVALGVELDLDEEEHVRVNTFACGASNAGKHSTWGRGACTEVRKYCWIIPCPMNIPHP